MPKTDTMPIFDGPGRPAEVKDEFERFLCRDNMMPMDRPELPDVCKKHVFSISAMLNEGALGICHCFH